MLNCTLYISGLPQRPTNKDNYIKFLLQTFNPQNDQVSNLNSNLFDNKQVIDPRLGIISVSRSNKNEMKRKVFITFKDTETAQTFKEKFNHFKINGKKIKVEQAKRDSYLSISIQEPEKLRKILQVKRHSKDDADRSMKRKLRRLRSKLSAKNKYSTKTINSMVENYKNKLLNSETSEIAESAKVKRAKTPDVKATKKMDENKPKSEKKAAGIIEVQNNKPNKILLVQNVPQDLGTSDLQTIFDGPGFIECRLVPIRNLAFIEYNTIENATGILNKFGHHHKVNDKDDPIIIGYAK